MQIQSAVSILSVLALASAQDYGVPLFNHYFQGHHANNFFQQPPSFQQQPAYQPHFPPHFRPLGFHQDYQQFKHYPAFPQNDVPFSNDLNIRSNLPNPYIPDYPNFYPYPGHFDESYPDLHEFNKIPNGIRDPIQILPSRFPPRVEGFVEGLQNRFSIYNAGPTVLPNGATVFFLPPNATFPEGAVPVTPVPATPELTESTTESADGSPTEAPESAAESTEAATVVAEERDVENVTLNANGEVEGVTTEASATESNTESS